MTSFTTKQKKFKLLENSKENCTCWCHKSIKPYKYDCAVDGKICKECNAVCLPTKELEKLEWDNKWANKNPEASNIARKVNEVIEYLSEESNYIKYRKRVLEMNEDFLSNKEDYKECTCLCHFQKKDGAEWLDTKVTSCSHCTPKQECKSPFHKKSCIRCGRSAPSL